MTTISDRTFHLLMGGLFLGSCFLDQGMRALLPSWNPPEASLITMVVGMIWVARFAAWRQEATAARIEAIEERMKRLETSAAVVEDRLREHLHDTGFGPTGR